MATTTFEIAVECRFRDLRASENQRRFRTLLGDFETFDLMKPKKAHRFVEDRRSLEAARLLPILKPGVLGVVEWDDDDSDQILKACANLTNDQRSLEVTWWWTEVHSGREGDVTYQTIGLVEIPTGFNGTRQVFVCCGCGKPAATLYLEDSSWRCRCCHGLTYASKYDDKPQKLHREWRELGGTASPVRRHYERFAAFRQRADRLSYLAAQLKTSAPSPAPRVPLRGVYWADESDPD